MRILQDAYRGWKMEAPSSHAFSRRLECDDGCSKSRTEEAC